MEVIRLALADRNRYVADSDAVPVPIASLLSKDFARKRLALLDPEKAPETLTAGDVASVSDGDTTQITVADAAGNMVSLTQTLGGPYGSFVVVGDTGLLFSNQMRHMHLEPDSPSQIRGGIRPRSNQSPTIVLKDGQAVMAAGSPGGDPIWQRLPQVLVNIIDFGMNIQDAIDAPRVVYAGPQETGTAIKPIWAVEERFPADVVAKLKAMGHEVRLVAWETGPLGGVTGVMRDPASGALTGGADPRGRSYAIGY
jgi:gamma-glutamyltranspeptidase/glutathione hydrolase